MRNGLPKTLFKIIFWLCWIMLGINVISLISDVGSAFFFFPVKTDSLSCIPALSQLRIIYSVKFRIISFVLLLVNISYWFLFQQMMRDILAQKFFCWSNVKRMRMIALLTAVDIIFSIMFWMLMHQGFQQLLDLSSLLGQSVNSMFGFLRSLVMALLWMGLSYLLAESVAVKEDQHFTI
jgi:hypothetical protein